MQEGQNTCRAEALPQSSIYSLLQHRQSSCFRSYRLTEPLDSNIELERYLRMYKWKPGQRQSTYDGVIGVQRHSGHLLMFCAVEYIYYITITYMNGFPISPSRHQRSDGLTLLAVMQADRLPIQFYAQCSPSRCASTSTQTPWIVYRAYTPSTEQRSTRVARHTQGTKGRHRPPTGAPIHTCSGAAQNTHVLEARGVVRPTRATPATMPTAELTGARVAHEIDDVQEYWLAELEHARESSGTYVSVAFVDISEDAPLTVTSDDGTPAYIRVFAQFHVSNHKAGVPYVPPHDMPTECKREGPHVVEWGGALLSETSIDARPLLAQ